MNRTSIEWCSMTVNPIRARHRETGRVGHYCEKVSTGCKHCYSSRLQPRFGMPAFNEQRGDDAIEPFLDVDRLAQVLRRRTPERIFWCDMTDLFGAWVADAWIAACLGVMALTPHHTHMILTKRGERRRDFFAFHGGNYERNLAWWINAACDALATDHHKMTAGIRLRERTPRVLPLPNVWHGDSVEHQETADARIPLLLQTPAAVRFLSVEPLLEPVDLAPYLDFRHPPGDPQRMRRTLDWVIVGGESGPNARPMHPTWARDIRDQCVAAEVPYFFKQWGEHRGVEAVANHPDQDGVHFEPGIPLGSMDKLARWEDDGTCRRPSPDVPVQEFFRPGFYSVKLGKKKAGRELDGRTWNQFPQQVGGGGA